MHCDFDPRRALEEGEQFPWRHEVQMHFGIDQLAQPAALQRIGHRQHHRGKPQLEIDRRDQLLGAAQLEDGAGFVQIPAHRLLQQHRRAIGQLGQYVQMRGRGQGQVIDRIGGGDGFFQRREGYDIPLGGQRLGLVAVDIEYAGDRQVRQPIGRQVGIVDDAAGPDDHDRARRAGARPALAQCRIIRGHWPLPARPPPSFLCE